MEPVAPLLPLNELRQCAQIREYEFRSGIPVVGGLIAGLRRLWNNIASRWYVQHAVQQQIAFNLELVAALEQLAQRIEGLEGAMKQSASRLGVIETWTAQAETRLLQQRDSLIGNGTWLQSLEERVTSSSQRLDTQENQLSQQGHDHARLGVVLAEYVAENAREAGDLAMELRRLRELLEKPISPRESPRQGER
jgi:hypothetical protein